jgi:hypothetical protein
MNNNIKLPDEMLSKNMPNARQMFSLGPNYPDCKFNEIYSMSNFVSYLPRQYMVLNMARGIDNDDDSIHEDEDQSNEDDDDDNGSDTSSACTSKHNYTYQIPIFARSLVNDKSKGYEYTVCSYRAIRGTDFTMVNAMLCNGIPLHFYADFDLPLDEIEYDKKDGEPIVKTVADAIKEALICIDAVIKEERETYKNPTFVNFDGKYTVSILYGHRDVKESAHVIFHFTGLRMFENINHCRYFYYRMLLVSLRRYPNNKRDNPLYFKKRSTGEYLCIMDPSVYNQNKLFRLIGQVKAHAKPYPNSGALFPDCGYHKMVCENPTCIYHVYRQISEFEFCLNDMRFIPRNCKGVPYLLEHLKMRKIENPDTRSSQRSLIAASAAVYGNAGTSALINFFSNSGASRVSSNMTFDSPFVSKTLSLAGRTIHDEASNTNASIVVRNVANHEDLYNLRRDIMHVIANMVTAITKQKCTFKDFNPKVQTGEVGLIASDSLMCPYYAKRCNSRYRPSDVVPMKHESNHIYYIGIIDVPMPKIMINCTSPVCGPYVKSLTNREFAEKEGFEHLRVNTDNVPEFLREAYGNMVSKYMNECMISSDFLML